MEEVTDKIYTGKRGLKVVEVTDNIYKDKCGANGGGGNGYYIHRESVVLKVEEVTDNIYTGKVWG